MKGDGRPVREVETEDFHARRGVDAVVFGVVDEGFRTVVQGIRYGKQAGFALIDYHAFLLGLESDAAVGVLSADGLFVFDGPIAFKGC